MAVLDASLFSGRLHIVCSEHSSVTRSLFWAVHPELCREENLLPALVLGVSLGVVASDHLIRDDDDDRE